MRRCCSRQPTETSSASWYELVARPVRTNRCEEHEDEQNRCEEHEDEHNRAKNTKTNHIAAKNMKTNKIVRRTQRRTKSPRSKVRGFIVVQ